MRVNIPMGQERDLASDINRINHLYKRAVLGENCSFKGMNSRLRLSVPTLPENLMQFSMLVNDICLEFGWPTQLSAVFLDKGYIKGLNQPEGYKICFEDATGSAAVMLEGARYEQLVPILQKWEVYRLEADDVVILSPNSAVEPVSPIIPAHPSVFP